MPDATDALDLRFAPLAAEGIPSLVGMIGLVAEGREPVPLRVVAAGPNTPRDEAVAVAMADVRASIRAVAARKAGEAVAAGAETASVAAGLVDLMRRDLAERGLDSDYTGLLLDGEDDPGEALATVRASLGGALPQVDAFRVTAALCRELQIPGGMDVLALVTPLCERVGALASDPAFVRDTVTESAARPVPAGLRASTFKLLAAHWREKVAVPAAPVP